MTYLFVYLSVKITPAELAPVKTLFIWLYYSRSIISVLSVVSDLYFTLIYVLFVLYIIHVLLHCQS